MKPQRYAIVGASVVIFGMLSACSTLSTDGVLFQADTGVYPSSWRHTGVPISKIASWIHHGFTASQAAKWRRGYGHAFSGELVQITAARAAKWRDAGFIPSQAFEWDTAFRHVSPQQAALWRRYGFSAKAAETWNHFSFSPQTAQTWKKAGVDNANEASAWKSEVVGYYGITQSQVFKTAAAWRVLWKGPVTSNMYSSAIIFMRHGLSPNTVKPYITYGLSMAHPHEILDAQSLVRHGLSLSKAVYYGKHDVKYANIAQYNHARALAAAQRAREIRAAQRARAEYNRVIAQACHGKVHDNIGQLLVSSPYANKGSCYLMPETFVSQWVGPKGAFVAGQMLFMTFCRRSLRSASF